MRIGIWSFFTILFLVFLVIINEGSLTDEQVDQVFLTVDQNMNSIEIESDSDLNNFIRYTVKGVVQEFHGGYYLAKFVNRYLPDWVLENLELIIVLVVLSLVAPIVFYGGLTIIVIALILYEKIVDWRKHKGG